MPGIAPSVRTRNDLRLTVQSIARLFRTEKVFIIGSQGILLAWQDAPAAMTTSAEIDAYPGNARNWEAEIAKHNPEDDLEASEVINALFGQGSDFHLANGFYIDGVDEWTAKLPAGWQARAVIEIFDVDGRNVEAIAPCPEDLIVSKLARLAEKDRAFIEACHAHSPLDIRTIEARIAETDLDPEIAKQALGYIRRLGSGS